MLCVCVVCAYVFACLCCVCESLCVCVCEVCVLCVCVCVCVVCLCCTLLVVLLLVTRVGQNRICTPYVHAVYDPIFEEMARTVYVRRTCTPYMTLYLKESLQKISWSHSLCMILASPTCDSFHVGLKLGCKPLCVHQF